MVQEEVVEVPAGPERIGFGLRLGAALIDFAISIVAGLIVGALLGGVVGGAAGAAGAAAGGEEAAATAAAGGIIGALVGAVLGIYIVGVLYGLIEGLTGASPGKRILKIKIGNQDGTPAVIQTLLLRYALKNGNLLLSFVAGITGLGFLGSLGNLWGLVIFIGCFFVLGEARLAIHDRIAKTAVYRKEALV